MTSLPANDMAVPLRSARMPGSPKSASAQNDGRGAASTKVDRSAKTGEANRSREMDATVEQASASDELVPFDRLFEALGENKAPVVAEQASATYAAQQMSTLPAELAALFQRVKIGVDSAVAVNEISADIARPLANCQSGMPTTDALASARDDAMPTLDPRVADIDVASTLETQELNLKPHAATNFVAADVTEKAVSVQQVNRATGFDAPISVIANQQSWFQVATPALSKAHAASLKEVPSGNSQTSIGNALISQRLGGGIPVSGLQRAVEPVPAFAQEMRDNRGADSRSSGKAAQAETKAEPVAVMVKAADAVDTIESTSTTTAVATPYQQIRAAVAEAMAGANPAQQTDYVSLYSDMPSSSGLSLRTLELSLAPPDLGRVNVKMNLTSRDLTLEIDASEASTAQMLTDDQAALRRDLLSDGLDLSSVLVSVTSSVSAPSALSGLSNGDQQASNGSRLPAHDASSSMSGGGREERKPSQNSSYSDGSRSREQVDAQPGSRSSERSSNALYI